MSGIFPSPEAMTISSTTLKSCGASVFWIFSAPATASMIESPWKAATSQRTNQRNRAMPIPKASPPPRGATALPMSAPRETRSAAMPATMIRERRRLLSIASHMGLELHLRGFPLLLVRHLEEGFGLEAEVSRDEVRRE